MSGDIEEFLRRAAERRKQQSRGGAQGGRPTPQRPAPPPPPPRRLAPVIDAEIIDATPIYGSGVSDEVSRHLDNRGFAERSSHLGEGIRGEAQNVDARVQQDLGQRQPPLQDRPASASDKTTDVAAVVTTAVENQLAKELLVIMSNPHTLRQAIVLSEIFARPEHRWD